MHQGRRFGFGHRIVRRIDDPIEIMREDFYHSMQCDIIESAQRRDEHRQYHESRASRCRFCGGRELDGISGRIG